MSADFMMRSVATIACAFTLSLFTTIAAYATVNVANLKSDGTACRTSTCTSVLAGARQASPKMTRVAKAPARTL